MINRVILIGRLTHDPELRYTPNGVAVTSFSIAVDRKFTNQKGERETDFIRIVTWQKLAENCANFLKKGALVGVDGRLQINSYENQEGRTVRNPEIVAEDVRFLEPKSARQEAGNQSGYNNNQFGNQGYGNSGGGGYNQGYNNQRNRQSDDPFADDSKQIDLSDDDLPF